MYCIGWFCFTAPLTICVSGEKNRYYSIVSIRNVPVPVPAVKVGSGWLGAEGKNFGVSGKNICISSSRFSLDTNISLAAKISFADSFSCAWGFLSICLKFYIYFVKVDPTERLRQQRSWTSPGSLRIFEIRSKDFHRHQNKQNISIIMMIKTYFQNSE